MLNFVTLFDSYYLPRGLNLISSLEKQLDKELCIYVLAMDEVCESYFRNNRIDCVSLITIEDLVREYPTLKRIREERTHTEFCWTLSSFSLQYVLIYKKVYECIYVDADMFFYNDPRILIDEMPAGTSVLITEHNYSSEYDYTNVSGKFCVQFMYFNSSVESMEVLEYWRKKCEEWCYFRLEDGKLGDQMYLDDWESRFEGIVYNCRNIGCGVAPWNLQKYIVSVENGRYIVTDKVSKLKRPLIFFHFHGLKELNTTTWRMNDYNTGADFKERIYVKYVRELLSIKESLGKKYRLASKNDAKELLIFRFMPIPYVEKERLLYLQGDKIATFRDSKNAEVSIRYEKSLYKGKWLIVTHVDNIEMFNHYLHEILWRIYLKECIDNKATFYESIGHIFKEIRGGKRLMIEVSSEYIAEKIFEYPYYEKVKVTRLYNEILSESGCTIYRDLLNPEEQNIIVED